MGKSAKRQIVLGIDVGTTAVKAIAVSHQGSLSVTQASYSTSYPASGWVEQNPEDWWLATQQAVHDLRIEASDVTAVGLSGQLNGLVFVSRNGAPLRPAIIWLDRRAAKQAKQLSKSSGSEILNYALTSPAAIHGLSKISWIIQHEPETIARTHKILFVKDYIAMKLTGAYVTDMSDAGGALLLDLRAREYARDFLDQLFDTSLLPELHESVEVVGKTLPEPSSALGIRTGIPVVIGAGDTTALAVGMGVDRPGTACATIGTAGHVAAYVSELPEQVDRGMWVMCHGIPGKYYLHGLVMTGGYSLDWSMKRFGSLLTSSDQKQVAYNEALAATSSVVPGSSGLLFLPYFMGTATPHGDSTASGTWIGLRQEHSTAALLKSVLEGVAYNFRDSFEIFGQLPMLHINKLLIGEGGAQSSIWPQVICDVLGRDGTILTELNASAMGAAILAGVGSGFWNDFEHANSEVLIPRETIKFDRDSHERYNELYRIYVRAYTQLRSVFGDLSAVREKWEASDE